MTPELAARIAAAEELIASIKAADAAGASDPAPAVPFVPPIPGVAVACNPVGLVRLFTRTHDVTTVCMPTEMNDEQLTTMILAVEQEAEFAAAIAQPCAGALWDGKHFKAIPTPKPKSK